MSSSAALEAPELVIEDAAGPVDLPGFEASATLDGPQAVDSVTGEAVPPAGPDVVAVPGWTEQQVRDWVRGIVHVPGAVVYGADRDAFEREYRVRDDELGGAASAARLLDLTPLRPGSGRMGALLADGPIALGMMVDLLATRGALLWQRIHDGRDQLRKGQRPAGAGPEAKRRGSAPPPPAPAPPAGDGFAHDPNVLAAVFGDAS